MELYRDGHLGPDSSTFLHMQDSPTPHRRRGPENPLGAADEFQAVSPARHAAPRPSCSAILADNVRLPVCNTRSPLNVLLLLMRTCHSSRRSTLRRILCNPKMLRYTASHSGISLSPFPALL